MSLKYEVYHEGDRLVYCVHGLLHRTDGPAALWKDGVKYYVLYGIHRLEQPYTVPLL